MRVFYAAMLLGFTLWAQAPGRTILAVGEFSNMRFTEEHAYGYAVELWRDGDSLIGLLLVSQGLQGDTPTGLLENVKYDSRSGALSFTAKLSTGVTLTKGKQEPTRDLYQFTGVLQANTLNGTFTNAGEPVQLKKLADSRVAGTRSYANWTRETDEILKFRGPKW